MKAEVQKTDRQMAESVNKQIDEFTAWLSWFSGSRMEVGVGPLGPADSFLHL